MYEIVHLANCCSNPSELKINLNGTILDLRRATLSSAVSKVQKHGPIHLKFIFLERYYAPEQLYHNVSLRAILPLMVAVRITYNVMQPLLIGSVGGQGTEWWDEGKETTLKGMSQIRLKDSLGVWREKEKGLDKENNWYRQKFKPKNTLAGLVPLLLHVRSITWHRLSHLLKTDFLITWPEKQH